MAVGARSLGSGGRSAPRGRGLVASALATAGAWLLEPAEATAQEASMQRVGERPVIAVFGLAPGCGATTVARSLAVELARRDAAGVAAVGCGSAPGAGASMLATRPASRLARELEGAGEQARPAGRICLVAGGDYAATVAAVRPHVPLVLDSGGAEPAPAAGAIADAVVLVARPGIEPALAAVMAEGLARVGPHPLTIVNRSLDAPDWDGLAVETLPDARAAARLALAGREPGRAFGRAVARLVDRLEATCSG